MNIIFFGSDDFAEAHLKSLFDGGHKVVACVTQPDRPKDRGLKMVVSPIKELALAHHIAVLQPASLKENKEIIAELKAFKPDVFIVVSYGQLLPKEILELPYFGAFNVHPSLLPKYRGAAPINWALINGETQTGVTVIRLNISLDAGDIIKQKAMPIDPEDNAVTLREKLIDLGNEQLKETLKAIDDGMVRLTTQDATKATKAPKLTKEFGKIDWNSSAVDIHNKVRGLQPWPCAYTYYQEKLFKILTSEVIPALNPNHKPGEVLEISKNGILVQTAKEAILIKSVHLENANPMDAHSFTVGHKLQPGFQF
ncbi:MAG: methionyl-tRNA formyltransferase [Candidatus Omnitrophica bacterium]|nr:methionyl-tRNA formyltransferase [Candidatus Omnitrophota bacterium]